MNEFIYKYLHCIQKEREQQILLNRIDVIQQSVNKAINAMNGDNEIFIMNEEIKNTILSRLYDIIDSWKGENMMTDPCPFCFSAYYKKADKWWNQRRMMHGKLVWIYVFDYIQKVFLYFVYRYLRLSHVVYL